MWLISIHSTFWVHLGSVKISSGLGFIFSRVQGLGTLYPVERCEIEMIDRNLRDGSYAQLRRGSISVVYKLGIESERKVRSAPLLCWPLLLCDEPKALIWGSAVEPRRAAACSSSILACSSYCSAIAVACTDRSNFSHTSQRFVLGSSALGRDQEFREIREILVGGGWSGE